MDNILLCSHNPILIKGLYGILRDEGHSVDIADHPADAVQTALRKPFDTLIIDVQPFGLSAGDAVRIIRSVLPAIRAIIVGYPDCDSACPGIRVQMDLAELKNLIDNGKKSGTLNI